ncbi:MAG TPA: TlpA disulfide reductase family protein [Marmoricola sp.]|jgi:thiol-disulfide isomerase/thioredoxin|nr:TlpA family protein disulfide reductase [Nocardioidaceae bacterium]MCO5323190.1 TlpA family protein disulfide reductase [Nocardioidaceae bacterium]HRV68766.1 TlpA disulfide reductase family protein [Marmoricola sp.]
MIKQLVILVMALTLLSGCGVMADKEDLGVKVNTPELRALKKTTGMEDCPKATGPELTATNASGADLLPDLTLPCLGGGRDVELRRLRGPMLISLWAQWCVNCPRELTWFQKAADEYAGRVAVLGINWQDTQPGAALKMAQERGATFPSVADVSGEFRSRGLPRLVMIDAAGKVVYDHAGELKDMATLRSLIEQHLGVAR